MVVENKEKDCIEVHAGADLPSPRKARLPEKPDALSAISRAEGLRHIDFERYGKSIDSVCMKSGIDALLDNPFALAAWARAKESLGHYYDALNLSRLAHSFFKNSGNHEAEIDETIFQSGVHLALSDIGSAEELVGQISPHCQSDSHRLFPVSLLQYRLHYAKGDLDKAKEALSHLEQLSTSPALSILSRGYRLQLTMQSGTMAESVLACHYDIEANDPSFLQLPPQIMKSYYFARVAFSQVLASSGYLNRAFGILPLAESLPESMRPQALLASALVYMGRKDCAHALSLLQGDWKHRPHGLSHGELSSLYWYEALCALVVMNGKDASEIVQRSTSPLMASGAGGLRARSTLLNAFCCCISLETDRAATLLRTCRSYEDIDSDVSRSLSFAVEVLCALEDKKCEAYIKEMTGKCCIDDVLPRGAYLVAAQLCGIRPVLLQVLVAIFGLKTISFDFLGLLDRRKCAGDFCKTSSLLSEKITGDLDMRLVAVEALAKSSSSRIPEKLYHIGVLGALSIGVEGREIDIKHWRKSKARELFTFIILHAGRDIARESLMEVMWPDMPPDKARNNYYVTWSNLKRILTSGSEELATLMPVASSGARCYVCDDRCEIDIVELLAEISAAHSEVISQNFSEAIRHYHRVAHLYRGDILPGDMYSDWLSAIREYYHTLYVETMISATQTCLQQHEHANAIFFIERALYFEKNREVLYDLAMRAFLEAGRREDAISTYHTCRHFLSEELGLDPSPEIKKLYNEAISA